RLEVDPAAVQVATQAAAGFRITAQRADQCLEFRRGRCAVLSPVQEQGLEVAALHVLGALAKAFLAILAGFDQVVEGRNDVFVIHGGSPWLKVRIPSQASCQSGWI